MRLANPYTGHVVDAPEDVAARLVAQGFKPVEEAPKKDAPRRRTTRKPKEKTD